MSCSGKKRKWKIDTSQFVHPTKIKRSRTIHGISTTAREKPERIPTMSYSEMKIYKKLMKNLRLISLSRKAAQRKKNFLRIKTTDEY
jgi:hypothetical protein